MQIIQPATPAQYRQYYDLRWRILCAPWHQPRGIERDPSDDTSIHLMATDDSGSSILGVGRLHFNSATEAQIRYMAIETAHQRRGVGSHLLQALEQRAAQSGATEIILNARDTAQAFYSKHGYDPAGLGHLLFDSIAHVKMRKQL
jgi:predicted GNAT family N-acyltransferase